LIEFAREAQLPQPTKETREKKKAGRIRLPRQTAGCTELADFFDRHDGADLLDQGISEMDPDRADLDRMLREYWSQPNTK